MVRLCLCLFISLSAASYTLANDAINQSKTLSTTCVACHGEDGNSKISLFPKLAGQQQDYLLKQLLDIQSGKRNVPQMTGLLTTYSPQNLSAIAAYFSTQKTTLGKASANKVEQGETLFRFGNPDSGVPACASCHGPAGKGLNSATFPALAGQFEQYTKSQLIQFKMGGRHNDPSEMMQTITKKMTDNEMDAVANYIQGLHESSQDHDKTHKK